MTPLRWQARIAVELLGRHQSTILVTDSVTDDGVFMRTDAAPPPMTLLRMQLVLPPNDTKLVVHGMVANTLRPDGAPDLPGVDVVFFASGGEAHVAWSQFIDHLRSAHPDAVYRPVLLARELTDPLDRYAFVDELRASDVSATGMFIATRQRFAVGSDVRVTVIDPHSGALLSIQCVVRRRVSGGRAGIGVEYCNLSRGTWGELEALVRRPQGGERALQAELHIVRAPRAPIVMRTLAGPWTADEAADAAQAPRDDSWSLPPESGWS